MSWTILSHLLVELQARIEIALLAENVEKANKDWSFPIVVLKGWVPPPEVVEEMPMPSTSFVGLEPLEKFKVLVRKEEAKIICIQWNGR